MKYILIIAVAIIAISCGHKTPQKEGLVVNLSDYGYNPCKDPVINSAENAPRLEKAMDRIIKNGGGTIFFPNCPK